MRSLAFVTALVLSALPVSSSIAQDRAFAAGTQYAYISNNASRGGTFVYTLPLAASSHYRWVIGNLYAPGAVAFGQGQVYVLVANSSQGQGTLVFEQTSSGPVSWVLPSSLLPEMVAVDPAGDVFVGQSFINGANASYQINVFRHPITTSTVRAFTMNAAVNNAGSTLTRGMAFDAGGNLWVKDDDKKTMDEYVPPFTSTSIPKLTFPKGSGAPYGSMTFDSHDVMYVTNSGIDVYKPPFTKNSRKAFTISVPGPNSLAVDASGNLYAACTNGRVYVFSPPFSAGSRPRVTMAIPTGSSLPFMGVTQ
ncbi:MAG: hypothetical protein JO322_06820 [Candidatus Eremiobacteraeota bacterium]|nr:hypothetical protein [Candidatus Eremiobacteraeota bacterium]